VASRPAPRDTSGRVRRDVRFLPLLAGPAGSARTRRILSVSCLAVMDVTALFLALYAAFALKLLVQDAPVSSGAIWAVEQRALPISAATLVLVFAKNRLYAPREQRPGSVGVLSSVTVATLIVLVLVQIGGWQTDTYYIFYSSWIFTTLMVIALRTSYDSVTALALERLDVQRRAVLIGPPAMVDPVARTLERSTGRGIPYRIVGQHELASGETDAAVAMRTALDPAGVDEVILVGSLSDDAAALELIELCRRRAIPVRFAPTSVELLSHSLQALPTRGIPLFTLHPPVLTGVAFLGKRLFDIVVASLLLVLIAPILVVAALAVKLADRGPVLHGSRRVGVEETEFTCLKLRTMRTDAEELQPDLEHKNEADGALFKIRDDPRVTGVGRVLRRFSIDELPQLINVIRGEMSLVGPRPLPLRDYQMLDERQKKRYLVLPGMTGLWQVSGRADLSFEELIRLDFHYVESWSIWLDLVIIARTIPVVFSRKGAF
jgi:exopolysaccharide biosynthesis polyprenyl glycosylphosphotransferase